MFTPKIRNEQTDLLMKALLELQNEEEAYRFFEDLCTVTELKSMAQRFDVAVRLHNKEHYQDIVQQTGASSATISRVNRSLAYGADGYTLVLDRMDEKKPE